MMWLMRISGSSFATRIQGLILPALPSPVLEEAEMVQIEDVLILKTNAKVPMPSY
jgi:hypothetical protein